MAEIVGQYSVLPEVQREPDEAPACSVDEGLDLDKLLSIEVIRLHTKTDDVPHVTDEQLRLYRGVAFEMAEFYTGLLLKRRAWVEHSFSIKSSRRGNGYQQVRLPYPVVDGTVYFSRGTITQPISVSPGTMRVKVPTYAMSIPYNDCCGCGAKGADFNDAILRYSTGYKDECDVPHGVTLGMLKFIAWSVKNPGDVIMTVRNRENADRTGIIGTNDGGWSSGAIEMWRQYTSRP